MEDLSLHVLDIAENSVRAGAKTVTIEVEEDKGSEWLRLRIADDGKGMDTATAARARDPFYTSKDGKRVGLGLPFLDQACRDTGGRLSIRSQEGGGTEVVAEFRANHPDMKPMGDMLQTIATLVTGNTETRFVYNYRKGDETYHFDSFES